MSSSESSSSNLLLHTNNKLPVTYRCLSESVPPRRGNYLILALPPSGSSSVQVISPEVSNVIWSTKVPPSDNHWKGKSKHLRENIHTFHCVWIKLLGTIKRMSEYNTNQQSHSSGSPNLQALGSYKSCNPVGLCWLACLHGSSYIHTSPLLKCVSILAPLSTN